MSDDERLRPIVLGPGEGRAYALGAMSAVFKADEAETYWREHLEIGTADMLSGIDARTVVDLLG